MLKTSMILLAMIFASGFAEAKTKIFRFKVRVTMVHSCEMNSKCEYETAIHEITAKVAKGKPFEYELNKDYEHNRGFFFFENTVSVSLNSENKFDVSVFTEVSNNKNEKSADAYAFNILANDEKLNHFGTLTTDVTMGDSRAYSMIDIYRYDANVESFDEADVKKMVMRRASRR